MRITVKDRVVKHNLELLKDLLSRAHRPECKAWIESTTGEIQSQEPSPSKKKKGEWKPVEVRLSQESPSVSPSLEVVEDTLQAEVQFDMRGWTKKAHHVLLETLQAVNSRLSQLRQGEKVEEFFKRFAAAQIELAPQMKEKRDLVREGWHELQREGAENLLKERPPGTYLFRKDDYTAILEQEVRLRFGPSVHCVTLTYLDEEGIVRDKTLVYKGKTIHIYDDDPNLLDPRYATVEEVLKSFNLSLSPLPSRVKLKEET